MRLMRSRQIHIEPGYDGVYGVIKIFGGKTERLAANNQMALEW